MTVYVDSRELEAAQKAVNSALSRMRDPVGLLVMSGGPASKNQIIAFLSMVSGHHGVLEEGTIQALPPSKVRVHSESHFSGVA